MSGVTAYALLIRKAAQFGAEADLVRVSVGLEDAADLRATFLRALDAVRITKSTLG